MQNITLQYGIGQDVYTIITNQVQLKVHKTKIARAIVWNNDKIDYELTDNFKLGGLYSALYRENGKIFIFETEEKAEQKIVDVICDIIHNEFGKIYYNTKDKNILENTLNDLCKQNNIQTEDYLWNMGYVYLEDYITDLTE